AGPESEVGGVRGIAGEHQVAVAPRLVGHLGEALPPRGLTAGLADQRVAVEGTLEDLLQQPDAVLAAQRVETERLPGSLGALHDAGADPGTGGIGVKPDPSGRGLLEGEGEAVEDLVGAQPDVGVAADVDAGAECLAVALPGPAVRAIAHHDEVGAGHFRNSSTIDLAAILDV